MQSYVVDQLLGESAGAAAVTFAMAISGSMDDNKNPAVYSSFTEEIHTILQSFYPSIFPYFLECVDHHHKHFLWTGPDLQIIPHSEHFDSIMPLLTMGELLDLPGHPIYAGTTVAEMPTPMPMAIFHLPTKKHHVPGDIDQPKKCRQQDLWTWSIWKMELLSQFLFTCNLYLFVVLTSSYI